MHINDNKQFELWESYKVLYANDSFDRTKWISVTLK